MAKRIFDISEMKLTRKADAIATLQHLVAMVVEADGVVTKALRDDEGISLEAYTVDGRSIAMCLESVNGNDFVYFRGNGAKRVTGELTTYKSMTFEWKPTLEHALGMFEDFLSTPTWTLKSAA